MEDKQVKINQLEAKLQIKDTELHEVREKYRVVCEDYEKLKEQNKNLLRRVTNEQFERYLSVKFSQVLPLLAGLLEAVVGRSQHC